MATIVSSVPTIQGQLLHRYPLSTFSTQDAQFDKVHLDIVGPLSSSRGFTYLLTTLLGG